MTQRYPLVLNGTTIQELQAGDSIPADAVALITPQKGGTGIANGSNNTLTYTGNYSLGVTLTGNTTVTLPTSGTLATTAQITGTNSGTNTGDNAVNTLYSGLVTNATHTGDATGATALTVKGINGTLLSGLATGILKNTTTTGVPSIAIAADFPTLNQDTTGKAAKATILETTRAIYGNNFDGSAAVTGIIASTYGGTGNGFAKFTGPTTSEKTFTLPNSSETLLYSGGALGTPSSGALTNCTFPTLNQSTSGTAAKATILETTRAIYGNNFDGSAAVTGIIASTYGGTGNGFTKFSGATTAEKTYTLPDANATLLYSGGALGTPASGALTNCTFPTLNQNTSGTAAGLSTTLAVTSGGTGLTALGTPGYVLRTNTGGTAMEWFSPASGGTVTSVDGSGGTTGLTLTGGAITAAGTLTLGGTLIPANGGTGVANGTNNTLTYTGNYSLGVTLTGNTAVTLPTSGTLARLSEAQQAEIDQNIFGFMPTVETTLAFNPATYVFTLGVTGTTFSYYRSGVKYTITGAKTVTLPGTPPTAAKYYIVIDATDGTLTQSTTPWTLAGTEVLVATVTFNNALSPKYILCDERHPCDISRGYHRSHHFTDGTQLSVIPTITSLVASTDTLVAKRPTLSIGALFDESLYIANAALTPAGSPYSATDYRLIYRTAAATWTWISSSMAFAYNSGTNWIQYDNAGTLTDGKANRWYNTYLVQTDAVNDNFQYVFIPGRAEFTSLVLAQAEDPSTFSMTGFPLLEYGIAIQLTWSTNAGPSTLGKCTWVASKQVKSGNMITGLTSVVLAPSATIDTTNADNITSGTLLSAQGGTANGFTKFSGPTTSEKTFTLPNSSETLLYSGGALGTPASGTLTNCTGLPYNTGITAAPHTVQVFISGSGTYTLPTNCKAIKVTMVGGGGGGGGGGTATSGGTGGTGGNTTFGTTLLVANGGLGGVNYTPAAAGTASLGGVSGVSFSGTAGGAGFYSTSTSGAAGGTSVIFSGGAINALSNLAGRDGISNTGGGGGGGSMNDSAAGNSGAGGSGGGAVIGLISSPSATYSYAVGAAGTAGSAGTSGKAGGAGGSGIIIVEEYYL
jgi:hypothetical protein